jgi:DNA-binding NtrC family response regulator
MAAAQVAMAGGPVSLPSGGAPMPPLPYTPAPPAPAADMAAVEDAVEDATEEPAEATGGSLATVAKAAAMKAERAAIEQTLRQVHWNRRKAAQILGVSYKTLLNKIKECGISRA